MRSPTSSAAVALPTTGAAAGQSSSATAGPASAYWISTRPLWRTASSAMAVQVRLTRARLEPSSCATPPLVAARPASGAGTLGRGRAVLGLMVSASKLVSMLYTAAAVSRNVRLTPPVRLNCQPTTSKSLALQPKRGRVTLSTSNSSSAYARRLQGSRTVSDSRRSRMSTPHTCWACTARVTPPSCSSSASSRPSAVM